MPSDYDPDLARLYAMRLAEQTPPTYDDGASMLMRDPAMMDVGLFGKGPKPKPVAPPVELQRRKLLGLGDAPIAKPAQPSVPLSPAMQQLSEIDKKPYATAPIQSAIQNAVNTPVSRRQFLEKAGKAAANTALRGALPELGKYANITYTTVKPNPVAPLTEAAKAVGKTVAKPEYSLINERLKDAMNTHIAEMVEDDDALLGVYGILRGIVDESKFSKGELEQFDNLSDRVSRGAKPKTVQQLETAVDTLINSLSTTDAFNTLHDVYSHLSGGYADLEIGDIVDVLKNNADISDEQIHEFLDTYHPGYDTEEVDARIRNFDGN